MHSPQQERCKRATSSALQHTVPKTMGAPLPNGQQVAMALVPWPPSGGVTHDALCRTSVLLPYHDSSSSLHNVVSTASSASYKEPLCVSQRRQGSAKDQPSTPPVYRYVDGTRTGLPLETRAPVAAATGIPGTYGSSAARRLLIHAPAPAVARAADTAAEAAPTAAAAVHLVTPPFSSPCRHFTPYVALPTPWAAWLALLLPLLLL